MFARLALRRENGDICSILSIEGLDRRLILAMVGDVVCACH
jgi:hypothetical protein